MKIVVCTSIIEAAKSFFNIAREKSSISRMLKDFAAKVYTTFFVQPKICNYYKTNKHKKHAKNVFHCSKSKIIGN
jgi:hypothetical protein